MKTNTRLRLIKEDGNAQEFVCPFGIKQIQSFGSKLAINLIIPLQFC